jgi:antitoxin component YwqK of YwqJK toxin-antitoxin module
MMTAVVWKKNGEKCPHTNVMNGNGVMVFYDEGGTESERTTYKDGESYTKAQPRWQGEQGC